MFVKRDVRNFNCAAAREVPYIKDHPELWRAYKHGDVFEVPDDFPVDRIRGMIKVKVSKPKKSREEVKK